MQRALGLAANAILTAGLVLLAFSVLVPPFFGVSYSTILSGSMTPALRTGDLVAVRRIDASREVQVGDIIGFRVEGVDTPVSHRVVEIVSTPDGKGFRTKGDAVEEVDRWVVHPEDVLGKVVFRVPALGHAVDLVRTPTGFLLLVVAPGLFVLSIELLSWQRPGRRSRASGSTTPPGMVYLFAGLLVIATLGGVMSRHVYEKPLRYLDEEGALLHQTSNFVSRREVKNHGRIPIVICITTRDRDVQLNYQHLWLAAGEAKIVEASGPREESVVLIGGFFPLLPEEFICRLFAWQPKLTPLLVALIPILPIVLVGSFLVGDLGTSRRHLRGRRRSRR